MRTFSNNYIPRSEVITLPGELHFEPVALSDAPALTRILNNTCSRSCDYTAGGILLWVQYFGYEQCIVDNTLFIKGLSEDISRRPSFAMPTGNIPLAESVDMIKHYCYMHRLDPLFTAVPEDRLDELLAPPRQRSSPTGPTTFILHQTSPGSAARSIAKNATMCTASKPTTPDAGSCRSTANHCPKQSSSSKISA